MTSPDSALLGTTRCITASPTVSSSSSQTTPTLPGPTPLGKARKSSTSSSSVLRGVGGHYAHLLTFSGGPDYLDSPTYPLCAILPIPGPDLFHLSSQLSPNIAYYLPRNVDIDEVSLLARRLDSPVHGREREWVEVEEEWVGEKLKAVTAYFGGLVASE